MRVVLTQQMWSYFQTLKDYFEVRSSSEIKNIEIASLTGQTLLKQDGGSPVHFLLPAGTYLVKVQMADGHSAIKKIVVK